MTTGKWHGGKGDRRRKHADDNKYRDGWDRVFGNDGETVNVHDKRKEKDQGR